MYLIHSEKSGDFFQDLDGIVRASKKEFWMVATKTQPSPRFWKVTLKKLLDVWTF